MNDRIERRAWALVEKLEAIQAHPSYKGIWGFLYVHNYKYDGPNWSDELSALKEALNAQTDARNVDVHAHGDSVSHGGNPGVAHSNDDGNQ